ncbi:MAG: SDR family oxidoreductase [Rhodospirillaceae bacterium]|nr:SDR family oxidoreductase [Rhodospirillaceae bacterium]
MNDYETAFVTGASSGIGEAIVRALAASGLTVHAVARRADRLAALAEQTGCRAHTFDATDTAALTRLMDGLVVDILVNNVGTGLGFGDPVAEVEPSAIDEAVATNLTVALHACRLVLPGMIARRRGHVVTVGSVSGLYPVRQVLYGATKGGLHLLHQNLRIELLGTGVRATEICPGSTHTEFVDHAFRDDPAGKAAFLESCRILDPEDVAGAVVYALDRPAHVNVGTIELTPTGEVFGGIQHDGDER